MRHKIFTLIDHMSIFLFLLSISAWAQEKKWTLDECLHHAWQHNIDVLQSKLQEQSKHQDVIQAIGNLLPNLDLDLRYRYNLTPSDDYTIKSKQSSDYALSSSVTLFDGLQNLRTLDKAKTERAKAQQMTAETKLTLALKITEAFVNILYSKDSLRASQEQLSLSKQSLDQVKKKYRLGAAAESDVATAEAQWALEEKNRVDAQNSLSINKIKLAVLLQLDNIKGFDVSEKEFAMGVVNVVSTNPEELTEQAFRKRPELKIAELTWISDKKQTQIARGNYWPKIFLSYSFNLTEPYSTQKDYWSALWDNQSNLLAFGLNFPIFNRLETRTTVEKAKISQEAAMREIERTKNRLRQTIYEVYTAAQGAYTAYRAAQKAEAAAKLSFEYAQKRYREGVTTAYDHNNTKNQWIQAQYKSIRAKYDHILQTKTLELYTTDPLNL